MWQQSLLELTCWTCPSQKNDAFTRSERHKGTRRCKKNSKYANAIKFPLSYSLSTKWRSLQDPCVTKCRFIVRGFWGGATFCFIVESVTWDNYTWGRTLICLAVGQHIGSGSRLWVPSSCLTNQWSMNSVKWHVWECSLIGLSDTFQPRAYRRGWSALNALLCPLSPKED